MPTKSYKINFEDSYILHQQQSSSGFADQETKYTNEKNIIVTNAGYILTSDIILLAGV